MEASLRLPTRKARSKASNSSRARSAVLVPIILSILSIHFSKEEKGKTIRSFRVSVGRLILRYRLAALVMLRARL